MKLDIHVQKIKVEKLVLNSQFLENESYHYIISMTR